MKKLGVVLLASLGFAGFAQAEVDVVKCTGEYQGKVESIKFKIDKESGTYAEWSPNKMAKAVSGDYVDIFATPLVTDEGENFEGFDNFKAPNGAAILRLITTADEIKFAINADRTKGTYDYRDIGSGNGNFSFDLVCEVLD